MKIAIIGPMCSGKTTLANKLKKINKLFKIISFASKVKEIASDLFMMENKDRYLLQKIGSYMRQIDEDIWVKYLLKKNINNEYIIIDDLRYENELKLLKEYNFKIIKLEISNNLQKKRLKETYPENYESHLENLNHESELFCKKIKDELVDLIINIDNDYIDKKLENFYLSLLL